MIMIKSGEGEGYWTLGIPFLRNYYSVWNPESGMVGLSPHITSAVSRVEKGPKTRPGGNGASIFNVDALISDILRGALILSISTILATGGAYIAYVIYMDAAKRLNSHDFLFI